MVSAVGLHTRYTVEGSMPYNGEEKLDSPKHNGVVVLHELNSKLLITMRFMHAFIEHAKSKGRKLPITKQEVDMSGVDESYIGKAIKLGAIEKQILHAKGLNGARSCYMPTAYGRAIIEEISNVEQRESSERTAGDSGSVQSELGSLAEG